MIISGAAFCTCNQFCHHHNTIESAFGKIFNPRLSCLCVPVMKLLTSSLPKHCYMGFVWINLCWNFIVNFCSLNWGYWQSLSQIYQKTRLQITKSRSKLVYPDKSCTHFRWHIVSAQGQSLCNFIFSLERTWLAHLNQLFWRCILGTCSSNVTLWARS